MNLTLRTDIQKLIDDRVKNGAYQSAEDVVAAGLVSLRQQEQAGDFAPGELDKLLAVADAEIDRGEVLDGEEVFRELRALGRRHGGNGK
jgi:antitoxin ParD1/3/4